MTAGVTTVIYPVKDLDAAKAIFTTLLGTPIADAPYYVGWRVDGQDIGLDPNGHKNGITAPLPFHQVEDIHQTVKALVEAGATEKQAPRDVGGGKLTATVVDADGNTIGLLQNP